MTNMVTSVFFLRHKLDHVSITTLADCYIWSVAIKSGQTPGKCWVCSVLQGREEN